MRSLPRIENSSQLSSRPFEDDWRRSPAVAVAAWTSATAARTARQNGVEASSSPTELVRLRRRREHERSRQLQRRQRRLEPGRHRVRVRVDRLREPPREPVRPPQPFTRLARAGLRSARQLRASRHLRTVFSPLSGFTNRGQRSRNPHNDAGFGLSSGVAPGKNRTCARGLGNGSFAGDLFRGVREVRLCRVSDDIAARQDALSPLSL